MEIIKENVTAKRIPFDNGIAWEVDGQKYHYGYCLSKTTTGKFFDTLYSPVGTVFTGDIVKLQYNPDRGTQIAFRPHEGQKTDGQTSLWNREHWINFAGDDKRYYGDIVWVTYKDPATNRIRHDKCYGISIQQKVHVIVWRKHKGRPTMSIPIENVIRKHQYYFFPENPRNFFSEKG